MRRRIGRKPRNTWPWRAGQRRGHGVPERARNPARRDGGRGELPAAQRARFGANATVGNVSALAGPGDDRRLIQIAAPVQPGNSGGPAPDSAGNAVGVAMARATGDIPQNMNFAVSAGAARAFLDSAGVAYATAPFGEALAPDEVAVKATAFTVLAGCWKWPAFLGLRLWPVRRNAG